MLVNEGDVVNALNSALAELMPAQLERMEKGIWRELYRSRDDGRSSVVLSGLETSGRFMEQPKGQRTPEDQTFERGSVTLTPIRLSAKKVFDGMTVAEVEAAKNGSLAEQVINWAATWERTCDLRATQALRSTSTSTYDGKALYATDHPQMSKSGQGQTFSNTDETAAAIDDASVKAFLKLFGETNAVGENGEKITWNPTHIIATTHDDYWAALTVLKSMGRSGVADNDLNALKESQPQLIVKEWRELTPLTGTARYLHAFNTRPGENGLVYINQRGLMTNAWFDPDAEQYIYKASGAGAFGHVDWRCTARKKTVA